LKKTADFAKLLFGNAKNAKSGPTTLVVHGIDEAAGASLALTGRNLEKVGVTHAGALDVKDVLRFNRIVFTADAYKAIVDRLSAKSEGAA